MASVVDDAVTGAVLGGMTTAAAASADSRTRRFDQLAADAGAMWSVAMTTPTTLTGMGYRTMVESGSGRTRAETNLPAATSAAGNGA